MLRPRYEHVVLPEGLRSAARRESGVAAEQHFRIGPRLEYRGASECVRQHRVDPPGDKRRLRLRLREIDEFDIVGLHPEILQRTRQEILKGRPERQSDSLAGQIVHRVKILTCNARKNARRIAHDRHDVEREVPPAERKDHGRVADHAEIDVARGDRRKQLRAPATQELARQRHIEALALEHSLLVGNHDQGSGNVPQYSDRERLLRCRRRRSIAAACRGGARRVRRRQTRRAERPKRVLHQFTTFAVHWTPPLSIRRVSHVRLRLASAMSTYSP